MLKSAACLLVAVLVFLADQASKGIAARRLQKGKFYPIFSRVGLRLVADPDGGWHNLTVRQSLLLWLAATAALAATLIAASPSSSYRWVAAGFMIGGAGSNLCDRAFRPAVVDYISFKGWRTFNLADSAIVLGALLLWVTW